MRNILGFLIVPTIAFATTTNTFHFEKQDFTTTNAQGKAVYSNVVLKCDGPPTTEIVPHCHVITDGKTNLVYRASKPIPIPKDEGIKPKPKKIINF